MRPSSESSLISRIHAEVPTILTLAAIAISGFISMALFGA
jgi:hypothetical protein